MSAAFSTFLAIMAFYVFLSYVLFPMIFYYFMGRTLLSAGNGFALGSIISILLWYSYGYKMV